MNSVRLRNPELDGELQREGFLRVPFLDQPSLAELRGLWEEVRPERVEGIWSNVHALPVEANRRIDDAVTQAFERAAANLFEDGYLAGASFLVKGAGPDSASTMHQDWNNVDEAVSQSLSIWCPLVDVDERNGALWVIPGSHLLPTSIRSIDTPSLYLDFTPELEPHLECVPAPAGHAVLYFHNLFHGSKPNWSIEARAVAVSGVLPRAARHLHYRRVPGGAPDRFEVLEVDRRFFLEGIPAMKSGAVPSVVTRAETVAAPSPRLTETIVLGGPVREVAR